MIIAISPNTYYPFFSHHWEAPKFGPQTVKSHMAVNRQADKSTHEIKHTFKHFIKQEKTQIEMNN